MACAPVAGKGAVRLAARSAAVLQSSQFASVRSLPSRGGNPARNRRKHGRQYRSRVVGALPEGVPAEIDLSEFASIVSLLESSFDRFRHRPAYSNMGRTISYGELEELSRHFGSWLINDLKLAKGDRVAMMLPNVLQYPVAMFGALRAGLTVVNTNPMYTARELKHQLDDSGARVLLVLDNFAHVAAGVVGGTRVEQVVTTGIGDMLGFPKSLITNLVVRHVKKLVPDYSIPGTVRFREALRRGAKGTLPKANVGADDIAFLQYTGGTTGVAKGAMPTHRNMIANMQQASA